MTILLLASILLFVGAALAQAACTFNGVSGTCVAQTACTGTNQVWTPSSAGATGCETQSGDCCTTQTPMTSSMAITRGYEWVQAKVLYCQSAEGQLDGDSECPSVCNRVSNPLWNPYRSDCSGFVSWAWGLPPPGRSTSSLAPAVTDITSVIDGADLQPGDALNRPGSHTMLFVNWIVPGQSAAFMEEPGCSGTPNYAHNFTSSVSVSGSSVIVDWFSRSSPFTAIRYNALVQNGAGSVFGQSTTPTQSGSVNAAVGAPSGPACTYKGQSGVCVSSCPNGQFRKSSQGATGCQAFVSTIKCCLSASELVGDTSSGWLASTSALPTGVIIGAVVGALLAIAIVGGVIAFLCITRRATRRRAAAQGAAIEIEEAPRPGMMSASAAPEAKSAAFI